MLPFRVLDGRLLLLGCQHIADQKNLRTNLPIKAEITISSVRSAVLHLPRNSKQVAIEAVIANLLAIGRRIFRRFDLKGMSKDVP